MANEAAKKQLHFPEEEQGMEHIHLNIKHDLGSGGDPSFSGGFHGAGSGGVEAVDAHTTGLSSLPRLDMDAATGYRRGPGSAGAHPMLVHGPVAAAGHGGTGGVGAGEGPTEQGEPGGQAN